MVDLSGLIAGVVLAVITGTLIPFLTTQFSQWAENKRGVCSARRDSVASLATAEGKRNANVPRWGPEGPGPEEAAAISARHVVIAKMGVLDGSMRKMLRMDSNNVDEQRLAILATWANGHDWWARFWAWRFNRGLLPGKSKKP